MQGRAQPAVGRRRLGLQCRGHPHLPTDRLSFCRKVDGRTAQPAHHSLQYFLPQVLNSPASRRPCPAASLCSRTIAWILHRHPQTPKPDPVGLDPSTSAGSVTSIRRAKAVRLAASISTATARALASSKSATTTRAPSAANRRAISRPMPRPAPVIIATFSCSFIRVEERNRCETGESFDKLKGCEISGLESLSAQTRCNQVKFSKSPLVPWSVVSWSEAPPR